MAYLLFLLAVLALLFSFSLSLYLVFYKVQPSSKPAAALLFLLLGAVATLVVGALVVVLVWPPPVWSYF